MRTVVKIPFDLAASTAFRLIAIVFVSLVGSWLADPATAAVYECKGNNRSKVLTDRPKGLRECVLIETLAPSPSGNGAPLSDSRMPSQVQNDQSPPAMPLPHIAPPPRPVSPETAQSGSLANQPGTSSGHEPRPCPPGINPLNPLTRGHCSPDVPRSPSAPQEP